MSNFSVTFPFHNLLWWSLLAKPPNTGPLPTPPSLVPPSTSANIDWRKLEGTSRQRRKTFPAAASHGLAELCRQEKLWNATLPHLYL